MKIKNLTIAIILTLLLFPNLKAQNPSFEWANQAGGLDFDKGNSITTDIDGNSLITGSIIGLVGFNSESSSDLVSSDNGTDIFIKKWDADGNSLWSKQLGGAGYDEGMSIVTDAEGNSYIIGCFSDTIDFNPTAEPMILISNGDRDIFVLKLDAEGNFVWVNQMGGTDQDQGLSIAIDSFGGIYTSGSFKNTVDFDPGVETLELVSTASPDIYIQKLDANGNLLWVKHMKGEGVGAGNARSIVVNEMNDIYVTGSFSNAMDFDPGSESYLLTSNGFSDIFVLKLDPSGNLLWAKNMGGTASDRGLSIATDINGDVYTTGYFRETADMDPSSEVYNVESNGFRDIFIHKLDADGNFLWAKSMGGLDTDHGESITIDNLGHVYTTGYFVGVADFDPGDGFEVLNTSGQNHMFIQKLDENGDFLWVGQIGGASLANGLSITTDLNNNLYTTGLFGGSVDFDPGDGSSIVNVTGFIDIFVQKLSLSVVGLSEDSFENSLQVYPNPTQGNFRIIFDQNQVDISIRILSITGQEIDFITYRNTNNVEVELKHPNGLYFLEITNSDNKRIFVKLLKE